MTTWSFIRTFCFPILLCPATALVVFASTEVPPANKVVKITFTADGVVDPKGLQDRLFIGIGETLDAVKVRQSLKSLYATGDFYYIECTTQPMGGGQWLDFRMVLKRYFARFHLRGPGHLKALQNTLARLYPLGESYSENREQRFVVEAEKFLFNRGYSQVELSSTREFDRGARGVDVLLDVQTGKPARVRKVELRGEMALPEAKIRKALKLKPGKPYSRELLLAAIDNLKKLHVRHRHLSPKITIDDLRPVADTNEIDISLHVQSGPVVEVVVEGAQIAQGKLQELLPIYREAMLDNDLLEEGREYLQSHLLRQGYSSADINFSVQQDPASHKTRLVYQVRLGQKLLVDKLKIDGLQALGRGDFVELLAGGGARIKVGQCFTLHGFEAATARVLQEYRRRGYQEAEFLRKEITIAEEGTVDLEFQLQEGQASEVGSVAFKGNRQVSAEDLLRLISTRAGNPFFEQRLESDKRILEEYYLSKGCPKSKVEVSWRRRDHKVDVDFQLEEGAPLKVDHIAIVGTERTRASAIARNIGFNTGDGLVIKQLFEEEQKLYNTAAFDQVRIRPSDPQLQDSHQTVIVGVRETQPRLLNFGIGFQEFEGPRGLFELSYLNVGGYLRTAQVRLKGSLVNQSIQLNLREPRPLNRNLESFATLQASRKEEVSFTERRFGASLQALRELSRVSALIFRYSYEHVDVFDAKVPLDDIPKISRPLKLSSFSIAFVNDTRNNPFDPERGAFNTVNLQVTAPIFKSDAQFAKLFTQSQYYRPISKRLQIAEAFRLGLARRFMTGQQLPISERFFAGGATTLRGFANDEAGPRAATDKPLGGNALIINNLELRFPLASRFGGALFYDTGNVFSEIRSIRFSDFTHSVGFGVRVQTPIGPIRFDYGFNLKPLPGKSSQHFFISFGPLF